MLTRKAEVAPARGRLARRAGTPSMMDRRTFLERLTQVTGSAAAAMTILPLLGPNYAHGAIVAADDNRLETKPITFKGATGEVKAYQAKPKGAG